MGLKTYEDIVHEALADCAEVGYPQHSISESIYGLAKERDEAVKELEAIKKQEHSAYVQSVDRHGDAYIHGIDEDLKKGDLLYKKPIYQHSFTVDGHTFYADSEVDILYLERKFGIGGKAKLTVVDEERF